MIEDNTPSPDDDFSPSFGDPLDRVEDAPVKRRRFSDPATMVGGVGSSHPLVFAK